MGKVFIGIVVFLAGAYVQKKFDVCGKLENSLTKAQESLKSNSEHVEEEE